METPNGTKRLAGFTTILIPFIAGLFGYDVAAAFPVEGARYAEEFFAIVGSAIVLYGIIKAKGPMWFEKRTK